jgi:prepilin-type N-terminal cleavage/methylation domain-containing protein
MASPRRRRDRGGDAGFTLVELMVALLLITIGILPIAAVQSGSTRDVVTTGQHTRALSIAQERMEVARAAGFTAAQTDSGQSGVYTWRTNVTTVATGLRRVDVTVTWTDRTGTRTVLLNDLVSTR